ncbi:alpha-1,3-mannosyl-glycoprotein 2-beta-N-acetylglucosaminyltransferase-like [Crassostrea virginica]
MRRKHLAGVVIFLTWNLLMYYMLVSKNPGKIGGVSVKDQLRNLQGDIERQLSHNSELLQQLRKFRENERAEKLDEEIRRTTTPRPIRAEDTIFPILLIACDRTTVSRSLDLLIKYNPNKKRFPIIVSQDCGHKPTADVIQRYVGEYGIQHIKMCVTLPLSPSLSLSHTLSLPIYFSASFSVYDLDISPDFYEYFSATFPVLHQDPSLWCVSAWNDNGKVGMVS